MDFKKFGWMLIMLGALLATVAGYFALTPYFNRWDNFNVYVEMTKAGYATSRFMELQVAQAIDKQRMFIFGWAAAISSFFGVALIVSSKKSLPEITSTSLEQPANID